MFKFNNFDFGLDLSNLSSILLTAHPDLRDVLCAKQWNIMCQP